mgnify:CR=1 FL=1
MKKISILSLHLGYGGIEKCVSALANLLSDKYEIEIACSYKLYDNSVFELDDKVKVKYLTNVKPNHKELRDAIKRKNIFKIIKELIKGINVLRLRRKTMIKYIKNTDSDIVISTRDIFDDWLGEYGSDDIVKIGWEHNHYHDNLKYAREIIRACSKLDYLVLVSKNLEDFYKKQLIKSKCKCIYIPNVLDNIPDKPAPLKEKRLISVGRLSPEKGFDELLVIFNKIVKNNPDWCLDIIGDGKEKSKLEKYIKEHKLEDKVTLHGFRNKDYIDKMLQKSSIYLMTSHTESFGIVLIEAMSHGLPCIAFSSAEGARELIDSGRNGYLINNRNFEAYIKKVEDLMYDQKTRKAIGNEGRQSIKKYEGKEVVKDWYNLIERK